MAGQFDASHKNVQTEVYDLTLGQWSIGGVFPENSWSHSIGKGIKTMALVYGPSLSLVYGIKSYN